MGGGGAGRWRIPSPQPRRVLFDVAWALSIGRGLNFANALEFGLKLMETSYVVAERFSAADLMHGPIAMVESGFPVFAFAPAGVTWPSISDVIDRVRELKAQTLIITDWPAAAEAWPRDAAAERAGRSARLRRSLHAHSVHCSGPVIRGAPGGDQRH